MLDNDKILRMLEELGEDMSSLPEGVEIPTVRDGEFSFNLTPDKFAARLREGALLFLPTGIIKITDAKGFSETGEDADEKIVALKTYGWAMDEQPGTLTISKHRGIAPMPNITVGRRGLVMPTAVELHLKDQVAKKVTRPIDISKGLGMTFDQKTQLVIPNPDFVIMRMMASSDKS